MSELFRVATYYTPEPGKELRKRWIRAYTGHYWSSEWPGFKLYEVEAESGTQAKKIAVELRLLEEEEKSGAYNARYSALASVSSTLDRLLAGFDGAAEGEADLGTIEHKGEKVTVKIKVVRGE